MDSVDNSTHICLICSTTIVGLLQYVEHFKTHAIPEAGGYQEDQKLYEVSTIKREVQPAKASDNYDESDDIVQPAKPNITEIAQHSLPNTQDINVYCDESSQLSAFGNQDFPDPDIDTDALLSPKYNIDFFQSLELKSINEEAAAPATNTKTKLKATQKLSILEDDMHAESLLPITSLLSNLDFSSDEDDECVATTSSAIHLQDRSWSDDDEKGNVSRNHPPRTHTGGKWKPGQGPGRKKLPIAGKWKPGLGPASHKAIMKNTKKFTRGAQADAGKEFTCNVCGESFPDRVTYSLHFGEQKHKDAVADRREFREFVAPEENRFTISGFPAEAKEIDSRVSTSTRLRDRKDDKYHCPVCDLYFSSSLVFQNHCDTKIHKDGLLRQGFKEYLSSDGTIMRVDLQTDTIVKDKQENQILAARQPKKVGPVINIDEKHECTICRKVFKRKYEMARHLLTRMHRVRAESKPMSVWVEMLEKYNKYMMRLSLFQCNICQFYFNRQHDFLDHMCSAQHIQNCSDMLGPIMCVACKFKTHKHSEMMQHLQTMEHYTTVENCHGLCIVRESHTSITCKFCGIKMHSAARIKRHCELRHADRLGEVQETMDVRPCESSQHECPVCHKEFKVKTMLQMHFLKVHKNRFVFSCTVCFRGFLDQRRLDNHLRTRFHSKRVIEAKLKDDREKRSIRLKQERALKRLKGNNSKNNVDDNNAFDEKGNILESVGGDNGNDADQDIDNVQKIKIEEEAQNTDYAIQDTAINKHITTDTACLENVRRSSRKRKKVKFPDELSGDSESELDESMLIQDLKFNDSLCYRTGRFRTVLVKDPPKEIAPKLITDQLKNGKQRRKKVPIDTGNKMKHVKGMKVVEGGKKKKSVDECEEFDQETLDEASKSVFSCSYCEFSAVDLFQLRSHYNENHPCDISMCEPCNQYFLSVKAYKIHCGGRGHQLKLREQSGETTIHKCPVCDKRFLQQSFCALHVETVHRHPNCEADLQRIHKGADLVTQLYGEHVAQVEKLSNDSSVSCPECGKFVRKETLVEHLRLHTGERPYICRFCTKSFAGRLTLRRHISIHLDMPLYICDLCGREFKRNSHLVKHMKQHDSEKKGEKFTCKVCNVWFYTNEELTRHMRRHGDRKYQCTWPGCQWLFVNPGELKSHMYTHTKERRFMCETCGFSAPTKTRLRRHARTHDNLRPFVCEYCPYKASIKTHLKRHMRIHIDSKPYACPYCNYTCNTHENIRKHILKTQKHKGKNLYPCKLCSDFGSNSSSEFKGHLMTVHSGYLRENAVDSLAVFSGLYKREQDLQKPKEGSEIVQVTKGRFFRNYTNPDAKHEVKVIKPAKKEKKGKESLKVKVISMSQEELDAQAFQHQQQQKPPQQEQQLFIADNDLVLQSENITTRTHSVIITPNEHGEQIITIEEQVNPQQLQQQQQQQIHHQHQQHQHHLQTSLSTSLSQETTTSAAVARAAMHHLSSSGFEMTVEEVAESVFQPLPTSIAEPVSIPIPLSLSQFHIEIPNNNIINNNNTNNLVIRESLANLVQNDDHININNNNNNNNNLTHPHQIFPISFSVSAPLVDKLQQHHQQEIQQPQQQNHHLQQPHQEQLQLQQLQQQPQQQQKQQQQPPSSIDHDNSKVFWVEAIVDGTQHSFPTTPSSSINIDTTTAAEAAPQSSSSSSFPSSSNSQHSEIQITQPVWYSSIPQVHAPNCQEEIDASCFTSGLEMVDAGNIINNNNHSQHIDIINNQSSSSTQQSNQIIQNSQNQTAAETTEFLPDKFFTVTAATQLYNQLAAAGKNKVVVLDQATSDL